ncbi:hypothetical protein SAMN05421825_3276 [Epilithonimonas hungarica]|uniref:Uncharacterized protein n=1 Tax=Epilithonimonas hungarica TaxID=454006 RepID=A0A1G7U0V9_9FLAO|nr:hypothetical protein SAMN05421825_3276 [Epilithonimonas hungarica]
MILFQKEQVIDCIKTPKIYVKSKILGILEIIICATISYGIQLSDFLKIFSTV